MLTNTSEGWGAIGNITVHAEPVQDLRLMAAYTYTESQEISGMPGSNAGSAYTGLVGVNGPHLPDLQRSQYVVPHKAIGSRSEEHTSELQSRGHLVCRLLLEKKK